MRATAIVRTKSKGSTGAAPASGVPGTRTSWLIGTLSGCCGQVRERREHRGAVARGLAHADDAATADLEAGVAHRGQRVETILVGARGDDLAVELRRRVDVVVVVVEARVLQLAAPDPA